MEDSNNKSRDIRQYARNNPWTILLFLLVFWWLWSSVSQFNAPPHISYTTFYSQLRNGNIQEVTIQGPRIEGRLDSPAQRQIGDGQSEEFSRFVTYVPSFGDETLLTQLEENGVTVQTEPEPDATWTEILISFLPFILLMALIIYQIRRSQGQGGGMFSIGKNKAKLFNRSEESVTLGDVAGAEGAKTEIQEIIDFLKNPDQIHALGGKTPKGCLLIGPPGTGKTLLARAVAGEAEVPFYSITGSDFMEMFVGVGASRVRNLFQEAKKESPAIIFIDELDSIGRQRGAGLGGGHDEREQTLNQLLSEMDGFEPTENVVVISATNRPDILDPALMRPGRFDRRITVDLPKTKDREEILEVYAHSKPLADDVDMADLARGTPGFSGADLENMLNEAALLAARKGADTIHKEDIEEARDKILLGLQRKGLALTDEEKRMIAYHEAGHAAVGAFSPTADPLHKISIVPRTQSMGVTQQLPERERYIYPKEYMLDRLSVMMGGRAAETLVFNTSTSGAENDLKQATQLARQMVQDWGMSETFQHMALGGRSQQVFLGEEIAQRREYSEATAHEVDKEIQRILAEAYDRTLRILTDHRDALDRLAEALLEDEEIEGRKALKLLGA
ncbi:ATP-dependent zinc metalloprotease FtsH [Desulfohalobium retbaense]|uniref:ATP-dependent zinc metalloprotease FtsH n=1 Tax=Desulfohalobium retbaense (strain ATCC 49708 / DSM 5692 / JCM 16813 / HR100) TaxID=485915 RepID=C8X0Q1_DESRD|nr:ATP-dependent zinc metalloprotease FtsH [Desulfohalobium retbaense]ACV67998.1 ATP-dependent metalloprotease FtsH [Desulfohalobium retbaense DSM 5692]